MFPQSFASVLFVLSFLVASGITLPFEGGALEERTSCSFEQKKAAIQAEIKTISSHSASDAAKIPLDPLASRTFYITPDELGRTLPPVNVGVTAGTVRAELVSLGTALDAKVPASSVSYVENADGSVTSNFIQTDRIVLPRVQVSEAHTFNSACQIKKITGTVKGSVACAGSSLSNPILAQICAAVAAAGIL